MGILGQDLNNINVDDTSSYKDDPKIIIHVKLLARHNGFKQRKAFKK